MSDTILNIKNSFDGSKLLTVIKLDTFGHCSKNSKKVIVHSNLVGGYFELGELGIHCRKTTIYNFKLLKQSNI